MSANERCLLLQYRATKTLYKYMYLRVVECQVWFVNKASRLSRSFGRDHLRYVWRKVCLTVKVKCRIPYKCEIKLRSICQHTNPLLKMLSFSSSVEIGSSSMVRTVKECTQLWRVFALQPYGNLCNVSYRYSTRASLYQPAKSITSTVSNRQQSSHISPTVIAICIKTAVTVAEKLLSSCLFIKS